MQVSEVNIRMTKTNGCGSDGRAVASDSRGPRVEYSHRQFLLIENTFTVEKTKKRSGMSDFYQY